MSLSYAGRAGGAVEIGLKPSARVQSLPLTPSTLSAHASTLPGTPTTSKHQWASTVRDVVAPTTSATSANKGTSQAGTTKAGGSTPRRIRP